jgi:hypothetical protein
MAQASGQVHRLVDMEVQEVSLVDRAANKRRFLIVKRSEGMGDKATSDTAGSQGNVDPQVDTEEGDAGDDVAGDDDTAGAIAVACDALEGLTRAVEQLQAGAGRGEVVGDVVQELRAAADLLQEQIGGAPSAEAPAPAPARADALVAAVGELVSELRASRKAAKVPVNADEDEDDDGAPPSGKPKGKAKKADEPEAPAAGLASIHSELKKISAHVEQQTRRIDRLEKRAGVPSSQPAGERAGRAPASVSDDVSWPLDLNSPPRR